MLPKSNTLKGEHKPVNHFDGSMTRIRFLSVKLVHCSNYLVLICLIF